MDPGRGKTKAERMERYRTIQRRRAALRARPREPRIAAPAKPPMRYETCYTLDTLKDIFCVDRP
jgi:hypothetical protein